MKVTIIIPVYNVENYLERCIESAVNQTYTDLEIILVDDGSEDSSGRLCDVWAKKDERIKVVHKENRGLSSARNAGKEVSSGEYIFYLDSDDYLSLDCIERTVKMCQDSDAQIAIVQMMYIAEDTNKEIKSGESINIEVLTTEQAIEASLYQKLYSCCTPAKLFKREVLNGIIFPVGKISEDLATCHLFLNNAKRVAYSNAIGYYYRQHTTSIMHVFNPKRLDALEWALDIEKFCDESYPGIMDAAKCRTFNVAIHLLLDLPELGDVHDKYFEGIWNEVKRTRIPTIICKKARFREKAAAILSFLGERMLREMWNSNFAIKRKNK